MHPCPYQRPTDRAPDPEAAECLAQDPEDRWVSEIPAMMMYDNAEAYSVGNTER